MSVKTIWFSNDEKEPAVNDTIKYFSVAQDLKLEKRSVRQKYRLLVQDYSRFIQTKKSSLTKDDAAILDRMFIQRFNDLINQVEPDIKEGKLLSQLLGITDDKVRKSADNFSREYKRLLKSRGTIGYIPKMNQQKLEARYKELISSVRDLVFKPILNLFSFDVAELPNETPSLDMDHLFAMITNYIKSLGLNVSVKLIDNNNIKITRNEGY